MSNNTTEAKINYIKYVKIVYPDINVEELEDAVSMKIKKPD